MFLPTSSKKRWLVQVGMLIVSISVVFWRVLDGQILVWDDHQLLRTDPNLQSLTFDAFIGLWTRVHDMLYIPTVQSVWFVNGLLFGQWDPVALHALNLLFHSLNAVLVFQLLRKLSPRPSTDDGWFAFIGAMIFALHPARLEAVAWIAGVKEVLAASAGLGSLLLYLGSRETERAWLVKRVVSILLMGISLAAKPSLVILPACLAFLEWRPGFEGKKVALRVLPYAALGLGFTAVAVVTQEPHQLLYVPTWWEKNLVAFDAVGFYLATFFAPVQVAPDYGRSPSVVLAESANWIPYVAICGLAIGGLIWLRLRDTWRIAGLFVVSLAPVLGFIPFYFQQTSTVADRYLYFPSIWLSLGVVLVLTKLRDRSIVKQAVLGLITGALLFYAYRSYDDSDEWRDDRTFFTWMLEQNPNSYTALNNLADIAVADGKFQKALDHLMDSREIAPWQPYPWLRSAFVMWELGRKEESIATLRALVAKYPGYKPAEENLQRLLNMQQ